MLIMDLNYKITYLNKRIELLYYIQDFSSACLRQSDSK